MRSGKDGKKQMDPLFPRLHMNDAEKGGPRAPPRNKMALREEINVPLPPQRSTSGSISTQPLPPGDSSCLVPSGSQSHVGCPEKNRFSLFCSLQGPSKMADRNHSCSSSLMNFDMISINPEIRILKPGNCQKFSNREPSEMMVQCHLFHHFSFYNSENSSVKLLGKEHDFLFKKLHYGGAGHKLEKRKVTSSCLSFSGKHQTTSEIEEEEISTRINSRHHLRDQTKDNHEVSQMSEENAETHSPLSTGKKILIDAAANQVTRNVKSQSGTRAPMYQAKCELSDDKIRLHDPCAESHLQCGTSLEKPASADGIYGNVERFSRKRSYSTMEGPSYSSAHPGGNNRIPDILESVNEYPIGNFSVVGNADRRTSISDTSVEDSKSGFNISPDDVVGLIGPKLFWEIRKTITDQQRIFAGQVFELHRLITVQRLITKSPKMLSEDMLRISKPSTVDKLPSQSIPEVTSPLMKPKVDPQKLNSSVETLVEASHVKLPTPKCDSEKGYATPKSTLRPYSESSTSTSSASDVKLGPWHFHPGSQLLVPVRLPSEGLVYKPYTGPWPPMAGCIGSVIGSYEPGSLTRADRDLMNTTSVPPAPSQQALCLQPYAVPVVDTSNSCKNLLASKGSDLNGSTAFERVQEDALPTFPINPKTVHPSHKSIPTNNTELHRVQVIKVIPYNPKSAYESAARIFRSIQEERQKQN